MSTDTYIVGFSYGVLALAVVLAVLNLIGG